MPARAGAPARLPGGRVSFWAASAAVFMGNALLSAAGSRWMLATLQVTTSLLATIAALEAWHAHTTTARPAPGPWRWRRKSAGDSAAVGTWRDR